jgi:hypothetical protein
MLVLLARQIGIESPQWAMGLVALAWCVAVGMLYGARPQLLQLYESILKWMVWFIIACFAIVVIRSGLPDPGAFALVGMSAFYGGLAHAPLGALVIVCELAGSYDLLVP